MQPKHIDLLVIGGGINGVGVASNAAGCGLSVVLCEKDDLASHTSSASSKLIHGGLRYLEQYEFKLVREALKEREILLKVAAHLVHPLEFVLPHDSHLRPAWMIRLGLLFYDYLSPRKILKRSKKINFKNDPRGAPLKKNFKVGFSYMDCQTDDARLVIANAKQARSFGANILTQTEIQKVEGTQAGWLVTAFDKKTQKSIYFLARAIVNASGAWVSNILTRALGIKATHSLVLVKGSHIVMPKMYEGEQAYILQNKDQRIVFVMPYKQQYTLIGTTDIVYTGDPNQVAISTEEIDYLLKSVNAYFSKEIRGEEIIWSYSGVRSLVGGKKETASKMTREYCLETHESPYHFPMISIFGGKLTTYRCLAEQVMKRLSSYFSYPASQNWTAKAILPGSDLLGFSFLMFVEELKRCYPNLPSHLLQYLAENYGSAALKILSGVESLADLGPVFANDLYEAEVNYLINEEWAKNAEDILWRRTKRGIFATTDEKAGLDSFVASYFLGVQKS